MKAYTILYNMTFLSGAVMNDQQIGVYADDKDEALKEFNSRKWLNSVQSVEMISCVERAMTHLDREFLRGELSTIGD